MSYRSDLDALDARHSALSNDLSAKTRELEQATKLLAQAKLPILDNIRVASPCTADWKQMTGDERARHCNKCDKQVFDLSEMTRAEAEALIIEKNGKLCARYYRRADGTILTSDCRIGVVAARKRKIIAVASLAMISAGVAAVIQRHNRVQLDGIDNVELAPPREATSGHVEANAKTEAPPPKPVPPPRVEVIEPPVLTMGAIAIDRHELELQLERESSEK
ncbi:MAG TPA: hypothetical protein VFQ65_32655 [Kofleriaceae bacterium]|nr:hypothetical protein [Kofleriaceae bacterium]